MDEAANGARSSQPLVPRFNVGLYEEHLEEASFLWEQRRGLLDDPEVTWLDIEEFEARCEAHIDALVVGGELALDVCREHAAAGDAGELHASLRVFCRQGRKDLVAEALDAADPEDEDTTNAVADALSEELPHEWVDELVEWLASDHGLRVTVAARIMAYRHTGPVEPLIAALGSAPEPCRDSIAHAIGRVGSPGDEWAVAEAVADPDFAARATAAVAALRLANSDVARDLVRYTNGEEWALVPLALVGGPTVPAELLASDSAGTLAEAWTALGLLGDPVAVEPALDALDDEDTGEDVAEAAANALWLITGADLYEEVFIPDEVDEDELFPEELEKLARGESLQPEGFPPAGTTLVRLVRDPAVWRAWWQEHRSRFPRGARYRGGQPVTPSAILATIAAERTPRRLRQLAYEELAVRYDASVAFETEWPVAAQKRALNELARWAETEGTRFTPGGWYFAAERIDDQPL